MNADDHQLSAWPTTVKAERAENEPQWKKRCRQTETLAVQKANYHADSSRRES